MPARDISGLKGRLPQAVFSRRFEGIAGYGLAFLAVAIALSIHLELQSILQTKAAFILFQVAILVVSIAGGLVRG